MKHFLRFQKTANSKIPKFSLSKKSQGQEIFFLKICKNLPTYYFKEQSSMSNSLTYLKGKCHEKCLQTEALGEDVQDLNFTFLRCSFNFLRT